MPGQGRRRHAGTKLNEPLRYQQQSWQDDPMIHTCLGHSAAATLRGTLNTLERQEQVLAYNDNLAIGPVVEVSGQERERWFYNLVDLGTAHKSGFWHECAQYWKQAQQALRSAEVLVWLSRRCSFDVAWFSHLISLLPTKKKFMLADFTEQFSYTEANGQEHRGVSSI